MGIHGGNFTITSLSLTDSSRADGKRDSSLIFSIKGLEEREQILEAEFHVYHSRLPKAQRHLLEDHVYMVSLILQKLPYSVSPE